MGVAKHVVLGLGSAGAAELGDTVHLAITVVGAAIARLGAGSPGTPGLDFNAVNRARLSVAGSSVGLGAAKLAAESGLDGDAGTGLKTTAAGLVAGAEGRPGLLDAVGRAKVGVASLAVGVGRASLAAELRHDKLALTGLGATTARLEARGERGPVVDFAVNGARVGVAVTLGNKVGADTAVGLLGDNGTGAGLGAGFASGVSATREGADGVGGPGGHSAVNGATVDVAGFGGDDVDIA